MPLETMSGAVDSGPFPVDPAVLAAIRPMQMRDVARVASLHRAAMGKSLWGRLGLPFLAALYRAMLDHPAFIGFVYEEEGRVRGFIAGSEDASRLYREVLRVHPIALTSACLEGLARMPARELPGMIRLLATTSAYFARSSGMERGVVAESMFCSFEPELRGRRISGHINKVLFDELLARGRSAVKITTEADNEAAIRQLRSWGFQDCHHFHFYGKEMRTYVLNLAHSPRVEARRRYVKPQPPASQR